MKSERSSDLENIGIQNVDPEKFHKSIEFIINSEFPLYEGKRGRKTSKFQKIAAAFHGQENAEIPLSEIGQILAPNKDQRTQNNYASTEISHLNQLFEQYEIEFEIETVTRTGRHRSQTFCHLRNFSRE